MFVKPTIWPRQPLHTTVSFWDFVGLEPKRYRMTSQMRPLARLFGLAAGSRFLYLFLLHSLLRLTSLLSSSKQKSIHTAVLTWIRFCGSAKQINWRKEGKEQNCTKRACTNRQLLICSGKDGEILIYRTSLPIAVSNGNEQLLETEKQDIVHWAAWAEKHYTKKSAYPKGQISKAFVGLLELICALQ